MVGKTSCTKIQRRLIFYTSIIATAECPTLPPPTNGNVEYNGNNATYSCDDEFELDTTSATRTCEEGTWSEIDNVPQCVRKL